MPGLVEIRPGDKPQAEPEPTQLERHLAHFHRCALTDALLEGTQAYWLRRAATFAWVGTPEADQIALNCRRHAALLAQTGLDEQAQAAIADVIGENGVISWE